MQGQIRPQQGIEGAIANFYPPQIPAVPTGSSPDPKLPSWGGEQFCGSWTILILPALKTRGFLSSPKLNS
ncbi:hypothetical protein [Phormidium sp. CCY1219]|uniref:hypothetical protein n=1 Tax=Phormidium sp. CCY1219 TaxID=2886104 RepID=UPI002D1F01B8|nr:hypothetical protein [Phormidium sp. CCY1219]MEB3830970.1 hypothetical protein [Phormidium sp. CCY1219]